MCTQICPNANDVMYVKYHDETETHIDCATSEDECKNKFTVIDTIKSPKNIEVRICNTDRCPDETMKFRVYSGQDFICKASCLGEPSAIYALPLNKDYKCIASDDTDPCYYFEKEVVNG